MITSLVAAGKLEKGGEKGEKVRGKYFLKK